MLPLQLKEHCQVLFVHFLCWPKSVPLQLTSRETVVAMESDIIATSGWAGWVSGFIRECFKTEPRSINAFFADKFISTMSSWLPASYHPPSRSVHFWTKITPLSHLSKTTSNPICSGEMCSVNPKSTKEPEVLNTFIWENNGMKHKTEVVLRGLYAKYEFSSSSNISYISPAFGNLTSDWIAMPQMEPILIYGEMNEKRVGNKLHSSGFFDYWKLDCFADLLRIPVASILSSGVQSEDKNT